LVSLDFTRETNQLSYAWNRGNAPSHASALCLRVQFSLDLTVRSFQ
jgi:hypothetical protein